MEYIDYPRDRTSHWDCKQIFGFFVVVIEHPSRLFSSWVIPPSLVLA